MNENLFEYSDMLRSPIEAFCCGTGYWEAVADEAELLARQRTPTSGPTPFASLQTTGSLK